jgi:hypothetical protein
MKRPFLSANGAGRDSIALLSLLVNRDMMELDLKDEKGYARPAGRQRQVL